ncbi:hypothetical protein [Burkholderia oklahomensis]|uniref:hypothetical protein n=1 Tax=Burkholderia oklahomensis TaxID=342113 RepID=UPI00265A79C6|nr:hypothetical protein [Burkholderia oklahomensis]
MAARRGEFRPADRARASSERDARKRMQVCCIPVWPKRLARPNLKVRVELPRGATFIAVGTGCGKPRRKQPEDAVTGYRDRVRTAGFARPGAKASLRRNRIRRADPTGMPNRIDAAMETDR